jgi:hypothetical protein
MHPAAAGKRDTRPGADAQARGALGRDQRGAVPPLPVRRDRGASGAGPSWNLILLGARESAIEELPHHLVFDRCYVHGDPAVGSRRGVALGSRETAVIDSWISDFKERGADSQAIAGWNCPGPFRIENNYLEAAGENVMLAGGSEGSGLVPGHRDSPQSLCKPLA